MSLIHPPSFFVNYSMLFNHGVITLINLCQLQNANRDSQFLTFAPTEISFQTSLNANKLLTFFKKLFPNITPHLKVIKDQYFDTHHLSLYHQNLSLRVRQYLKGSQKCFDIICISWSDQESDGSGSQPFHARTNPVALQNFKTDNSQDLKGLLRQYQRQGITQIFAVNKKRWTFELAHMAFKPQPARLGNGHTTQNPSCYWVKEDIGLRIVVDVVNKNSSPTQCLLEIEYDHDTQIHQAHRLTNLILKHFSGNLSIKKNNRIFNQLKHNHASHNPAIAQ